ncbi:MAG: hypothetical protein HY552_05655 [Elusimicrobia bacterium]|nr:hypothetical protein [Elusimicrobiota bacterium]
MTRGGFSLIETVVAAGVVILVLMGSFAVIGSMARSQKENLTKSTVVGWSAASLGAIGADVEKANVLLLPTAAGLNGNTLAVCQNWSQNAGGPGVGAALDATQPTVTVVYCGAGTGGAMTLYRYALNGCTTPTAACSSSVSGAAAVASGVRLDGTHPTLFSYVPSLGGVGANFTVGDPSATANLKNPQFLTFNTTLMPRQTLETN